MVGAGGAGAAVDISFGSLEAAEINPFVTCSNRDSVVVGMLESEVVSTSSTTCV